MAGGGYRYEQDAVRAEDLLPTAEVVALAKGLAARACAAQAAEVVWMSRESAHTWIERVSALTLAVLVRLCPDVAPDRLARCLGLDPVAAPEALVNCRRGRAWRLAEMVDAIARDVLGAGS